MKIIKKYFGFFCFVLEIGLGWEELNGERKIWMWMGVMVVII